MKRIILFRAKRKDNGQWVYGTYQKIDNNINIPFCRNIIVKHIICAYFPGNWNMGRWENVEIDIDTLCQLTGLQDIKEKDIYEGDIVSSGVDIGVVEFDCGVFGINWDYFSTKKHRSMVGTFGQRHNLRRMDDDIIDHITVIGNIYDHNDKLLNEI